MTLPIRSSAFPAFRQIWRDIEQSRSIEDILDDTLLSLTNTEESDTGYVVSIPVPGFKREWVMVEVTDQERTIKVTAFKGDAAVKGNLITRVISVPEDVDSAQISAKLEDGLLTVSCPKVAAAKPRKVDVL